MKLNPTIAASTAAAILAALDAAATPGKIKFYTAPMPADPSVAITTQTLLGTLGLTDPAAVLVGSTLTFNAISDDTSADADGTCTWARFTDGDDAAVMDMTVTITSGNGDLKAVTVDIGATGVIKLTSLAVTI